MVLWLELAFIISNMVCRWPACNMECTCMQSTNLYAFIYGLYLIPPAFFIVSNTLLIACNMWSTWFRGHRWKATNPKVLVWLPLLSLDVVCWVFRQGTLSNYLIQPSCSWVPAYAEVNLQWTGAQLGEVNYGTLNLLASRKPETSIGPMHLHASEKDLSKLMHAICSLYTC